MKRRLLTVTILGALVALALVVMAPVAIAGDVTRIIYAQNQNDLNYYKVGATAGTFNVSVSWTKADGTGAPTFPVARGRRARVRPRSRPADVRGHHADKPV